MQPRRTQHERGLAAGHAWIELAHALARKSPAATALGQQFLFALGSCRATRGPATSAADDLPDLEPPAATGRPGEGRRSSGAVLTSTKVLPAPPPSARRPDQADQRPHLPPLEETAGTHSPLDFLAEVTPDDLAATGAQEPSA